MGLALQFVGTLLLIATIFTIAGIVSSGIEDALGEKTLRDRTQERD